MSTIRTNAIVDAGGGNTATINGKTPLGTSDFASQVQAEAGTDNATVMTPLRVAQALAAGSGMVLLGTLSTTSGTTQTLSGLTLTEYSSLLLVVDNVSNDAGAGRNLLFGTAQLNVSSGVSGAAALSGFAFVPLGSGVAGGFVASGGSTPSTMRFTATGYSSASTSVAFTWDGAGNFDAGSISIYGLKK